MKDTASTTPSATSSPSDLSLCVSLEQTINMGNYESAKVFISVSGVKSGMTEGDISGLVLTEGQIAYRVIADRIRDRVVAIRKAKNDALAKGN